MNLFSLLAFVIKARFKNRFTQNPIALLWSCIVMVIAVGQGVGAIYLLGMITDADFQHSKLIGVINLTIAILIVISNFFPTYRPTSTPIRSFHPMQQWKRGLFSVLCDIATLKVAGISAFYLVLLISPAYNVSAFVLSSVTVITSILIERSFRLLLDYSISMRFLHAIINILIMSILGDSLVMSIRENIVDESYIVIGAALAALIHHFILAYVTAGVLSSNHRYTNVYPSRSLRKGFAMSRQLALVYLRSRLVFSALGTGMFFKILALFLLSRVIKNGDLPIDPYFFFYLVAASITPFNSVLNNAFGHGVPFWDTVRLHTSGIKPSVLLYIHFCLFPCTLDMLITFVAALAVGLLNLRFVFFYGGVLVSLISIGYWSSLMYPRSVQSLPSFTNPRSNTSPLISFALTIPVAAGFAAMFKSPYLFILFGLAIITLCISVLTIQTNYSNIAQRTYAILHS